MPSQSHRPNVGLRCRSEQMRLAAASQELHQPNACKGLSFHMKSMLATAEEEHRRRGEASTLLSVGLSDPGESLPPSGTSRSVMLPLDAAGSWGAPVVTASSLEESSASLLSLLEAPR